MSRKTFKILLWFVIVVILGGCAAALLVHDRFYKESLKGEYNLYISKQMSYDELLDSLKPHLEHPEAFEIYAKRISLSTSFKPGHYVIKPEMSNIELARAIKLGMQTPVRVTLNNIRIPSQLAAKLAPQIDADSASIMQAITSSKLAEKYGVDSVTLFSMFLPNTYEFYWTVTPEEFVDRMTREYERFWTEERDAKRERSGLSRLEVATLASIVAEETLKSDEKPRIAGVYINRLRKGMPLQADPTIKYAMQDFGLRRILHKHLKYPSPYNTYINRGLPPSPIRMVDGNTIDAVLNFEENNYLYFCARPTFDGYHSFASSYSQHLRNARAYHAALNARKIK